MEGVEGKAGGLMRVEGHRDEHLSFIMPILIGFVGHRRTYSREKREAEFIIVKKLLFFLNSLF